MKSLQSSAKHGIYAGDATGYADPVFRCPFAKIISAL